MSNQQLINQAVNFLQVQCRSSMRIQHCRQIQLMVKHHAINYYKQKLFSVVQLLRHIHTLNDLTTVNITTPAIKQLLPET